MIRMRPVVRHCRAVSLGSDDRLCPTAAARSVDDRSTARGDTARERRAGQRRVAVDLRDRRCERSARFRRRQADRGGRRDPGRGLDAADDRDCRQTPELPARDGWRRRRADRCAWRDASTRLLVDAGGATLSGRARSRSTSSWSIRPATTWPARVDRARERAAEPLDLSQLHLSRARRATAAGDVRRHAGPGALLVLGQSRDPTKNGGAPVAVAYGAKLISLNERAALDLPRRLRAGVVLDTVAWGALSDDADRARPDRRSGTRDFCPASSAVRDAGSFGTPGAPNPALRRKRDGGSRPDVSVAD